MPTAVFTDPACLRHVTPTGHPECVARLESVLAALDAPEFAPLMRRQAPAAGNGELLRCHPQTYLDRIRAAIPGDGTRPLDADTHVSPGSWHAATGGLGQVLGALDITVGAGPVVVAPIASLDGALAADLGVVAAWSAISPDPQAGIIVCLGIVDLPVDGSSEGAVRVSECVADERMSAEGLRFEATFGDRTWVWLWTNEQGLSGSVTDR